MRKNLIVIAVAFAVVLGGATVAAHATYPGAAGRIAFPSSGTGGNIDVYTALPGGGDQRRLTDAKGFDGCPAYSPDGRTIAFCSERRGKFEIWLMDGDGRGQRQLTRRRYDALWPDFSPDGRRVAFQTSDGSPAAVDIYVVPVTGGKPRRFTGAPGDDQYPAFSPDGKTIAFVSQRKGTPQIWLMNASDGHNQRQLTRDAAAKNENPDWSPDGRRIAYQAAGDIWVMNPDGSARRNLTRSRDREFGVAWSPDGRKIAYVRRLGGQKRLFVMNADGSGKRPLGGPGNQLVPAWQPLVGRR
jgi:Tol biopolymer transport system component